MVLTLAALAGPLESFEAGNTAIAAEDFDSAVTAYRAALASGGVDADVYFNLGNALYRQDQVPGAIVAWRRAAALSPRDPDPQANLDFARRKVRDRLAVPTSAPWFAPWHVALTPREGAWLASLVAGVGLVLLALRGRLPGAVPPGALLVGVGAVLGAGAWAAAGASAGAVTLRDVRATSDLGGGVDLFTLSEGAEVATEAQSAGKTLLRLPDGRRGWVPDDTLGSVDPEAPFPVL